MSKKKDGKNTSTGRDKYSNTMQTETYRQQMAVTYMKNYNVLTKKLDGKTNFASQNKGRYG